jgi:hypothetical protein
VVEDEDDDVVVSSPTAFAQVGLLSIPAFFLSQDDGHISVMLSTPLDHRL